jgi:hypothetical protein
LFDDEVQFMAVGSHHIALMAKTPELLAEHPVIEQAELPAVK